MGLEVLKFNKICWLYIICVSNWLWSAWQSKLLLNLVLKLASFCLLKSSHCLSGNKLISVDTLTDTKKCVMAGCVVSVGHEDSTN